MVDPDVVVIGGGNAALCAALSARDHGAGVLVLERAPQGEHGGNTAFTAGAMRVAYRGKDDIVTLIPDITDAQMANTEFGSYTEADFFDDIARVTQYRADPELTELIVTRSFDTLRWMRDKGVRFLPIYGRQAFEIDGRFKFWGGLTIETSGGGRGLVESLTRACNASGIEIRYNARAHALIKENGAVKAVEVFHGGQRSIVRARAVILASGGFEANTEWRTRYLGPGWDLAKVRGSRYNTGDGIRMALDIGASPHGQWSGAHAVAWDRNAPDFGDLEVGDGFQKHSYPFGVMVNTDGERFLDEGADFRNYTYAMYGRRILEQQGQVAWQIFDQRVAHLLRDEYRIRQVTKVSAGTLEELASRLDGVSTERLRHTLAEFNSAVDTAVPFNPNERDGRRTRGLAIDKSNWANPLDSPPFEAYQVTCGVTFTFGGLRVSRNGEVIDDDGYAIGGLYACGELVGGIFYFNYPGGSGLTSGAVIGRIAGAAAAERSLATQPKSAATR